MKPSIYNYVLKLQSGEYILFNTLYDSILAMKPDLFSIYQKKIKFPEELERLHNDFYNALVNQQFLVNEEKDEYGLAVENIKKIEASPATCHITVNPTLDCNCRCWYCYEEHRNGSRMSGKTLEATKQLIESRCADPEIKQIILSFFGGEPLLYYNEIVKDILQFSKECTIKSGKILDVYITTNGYLLYEDIINDLKQYSPYLQIALDGNEELHNKTKHLKDKSGTYQTIRSNIMNALDNGINLTLRCNYSEKNILSFKDVAEDFKRYSQNPRLEISMHKIWQVSKSEELNKAQKETYEKFEEYGYNVEHMPAHRDLCYADKDKNLVVNYDGRIYKCTARDFNEANSVGLLQEDGSVIYNEKALLRRGLRFHNAECRQCIVFPLCMQTCSQNLLETEEKNKCLSHSSKNDKDELVRNRVEILTSLNVIL